MPDGTSVSGARRTPKLTLASRLRCAIALLSLLGVTLDGEGLLLAPAVGMVVAIELVAERRPRLRRFALVASMVLVAVVVVVVPSTMALPLLLVPAYRAGEHHGSRVALLVSLAAGVPAVQAGLARDELPVAAQWVLLGVLLGQLGAWNRRVELQARRPGTGAAREAGRLLGRLQDLARQLPTGLDVPAVASLLVREAGAVGIDRAALLVRVDGEAVTPVALHGVDRVPWRDPVSSPGAPYDAWHGGRVVHDVRPPDVSGRRRGSSLLALPLADRDDELLGLLVLERDGAGGFDASEREEVELACERLVPHLHAAMAFTALRHVAEVGERERLAREMHDGVAQDLSALGFVVDTAARSTAEHPAAAAALLTVRTELNRTIRDIRSSISDLRSTALPARGLGAAVTSHLHALAAGSDVAVKLAIQESPYRLPAYAESVLLRLVQDFLGSTRARDDVTSVAVELDLADTPRASLWLVRDGGGTWEPDAVLVEALRALGGAVVMVGGSTGVRARLEIGTAAPVHVPGPREAPPSRQAVRRPTLVRVPAWTFGRAAADS